MFSVFSVTGSRQNNLQLIVCHIHVNFNTAAMEPA